MADFPVRQVWHDNLLEEFHLIGQMSQHSRWAALDTEFPGTVFEPEEPWWSLSLDQHYSSMKENVDALNIIQLGLTLSNKKLRCTWEFNFRDFNPRNHPYNPDSVALLQSQGIDFDKNSLEGIDSREFAALFFKVFNPMRSVGKAWITFHGLYDLGYLMKILTRKPLPENRHEFMMMVKFFLGRQVYDLKPIAHCCRLRGGLEKVAKSIGVKRAGGKSHQAGSDSLLTMDTFFYLFTFIHGPHAATYQLFRANYSLYGLTWLPKMLR